MRAMAPENFPWHLGYIVDGDGWDTGFAAVRGRIRRKGDMALLEELAADHRIIGICCQGVYPMIGELSGNVPDADGPQEGRHEDYLRVFEGWAHCFRDPDAFLPPELPRLLFSNSDNLEPAVIQSVAGRAGPAEKQWDFLYTCMPDQANFLRKNWKLARPCVMRFAEELGLRGVLVGLASVDDAPVHPRLDLMPKLPWPDFLHVLRQSRMAFFPNSWDPSPVVIAQALSLDVPILVNQHILGGWQYVAPATGRFFDGPDDAMAGAAEVLSNEALTPLDYYNDNYGRANAGARLADFLRLVSEGADAADVEQANFYSPRNHGLRLPKRRD
jgi:hypothetical protein